MTMEDLEETSQETLEGVLVDHREPHEELKTIDLSDEIKGVKNVDVVGNGVESTERISFTEDLANWMSRLPEELQRVPIIFLAIPGSHDSGTYPITSKSSLAPDAEAWLQRLSCLGEALTYFVSRWSKTQSFDVKGQLESGVRFFDLRVATRPGDDLHIVHGLYADPVVDVLHEIRDYLDSHRQEIVIMDCQHFYDMKEQDHRRLIALLTDTFGKRIVPVTGNYYMHHLTLEYMKENRYQVLIVYRTHTYRHPFYPSGCYPTPWPNTTSSTELLVRLNEGLSKRNNNFGYVSQFVLTPSGWTVFRNLFGSLKKFGAVPLYRDKLDWIREQSPGQNGVNVIIGDFVDIFERDFPRAVVKLNGKLLRQSELRSDVVPPVTG